MKIFIKIFFTLLLFVGLEKAIRTQTDAFRVEKILADCAPNSNWDVTSEIDPKILNQTFTFLGSGVQCYAFLGEDKETVLKVFKQYHFGLPSRILQKIPLPKIIQNQKNSILEKRANRINSIFSSCKIAFEHLSKQTGIFHLNLNPKDDIYPTVTVFDKIRVKRTLDLNRIPFLLQKKADLIFPYLESHPNETKKIIDSLFTCIDTRLKMGIINSDPIMCRNFGIYKGKVIEIDTGSFHYHTEIENPLFSKRELVLETLQFKDWMTQHKPEYTEYFNEKLMQAIRT